MKQFSTSDVIAPRLPLVSPHRRERRRSVSVVLLGLFLLFLLGVAALGAMAIVTLYRATSDVDVIAASRVPSVVFASSLERDAESIVSFAPQLAAATTQTERLTIRERIDDRIQAIDQTLVALTEVIAHSAVLQRLVDGMGRVRDDVIETIDAIDERTQLRVDAVRAARTGFAEARSIAAALPEARQSTLDAIAEGAEPDRAMAVVAGVNALDRAITSILAAGTVEYARSIRPLAASARSAAEEAGAQLSAIDLPEDAPISALVVRLGALLTPENDPLAARSLLLNLDENIANLLRRQHSHSTELVGMTSILFGQVEDGMNADGERLTDHLEGSILLIAVVFALCVLLVILGHVYVKRAIVRRIYRLRDAMADWLDQRRVTPPLNGNDELSDISESLSLFIRSIEDREETLRQSRDRLETLTHEATEARIAAETANRAKSQFLVSMSHELRTPLNSILGFAELIRDSHREGPVPSWCTDYAGDIHQSGTHLMDVINDLLDLAKIEAGRMEIQIEPLSATHQIVGCLRLVRQRAENKGIGLTPKIEEGAEIVVADRRAFRQMLFNLLSNAIKFTPEKGTIHVTCRPTEADSIAVSVSDTGDGIPKSEQQRILQPFEQLTNRFTRSIEGTGLGLPLVKSLITLHGGAMTLESEPGQGTTVTLEFPRHPVGERV